MRRLFLSALFVFMALPAWSHEEVDARNRVSFQVEASREVENDWVIARFAVMAEGKDPAAVANSVNTQMKIALANAKRTKGVEVGSGAYVTQPVYDDGRVVRWRARQELRVESGDVDRLAKLIGALQEESVLLSGIDFSVKSETRMALEDELIGQALTAFRLRAALIAKAMNAADWSLVALSVGRSGGQPRMVQMRAESNMMSISKTAPPAFEAGTSEIRVHVDGKVELE
jgi:predicted secreted protein